MSTKKLYQDREWLEEQYWSKGLTIKQVANLAGCSVTHLHRCMKQLGIETRASRDYLNEDGNADLYRDKDWLIEQYNGKGLSAEQIARQVNRTKQAIQFWLRQHGISQRDREEARLKRLRDDDARAACSGAAKKRWESGVYQNSFGEEFRRKASSRMSGRVVTEEEKESISRTLKRRWESLSPEQQAWYKEQGRVGLAKVDQQKRLKAVLSAGKENTSIEIALQKELNRRDIQFLTHVTLLGICKPDILILSERIVVQADGDYWHHLPHVEARDHRQDKALLEAGYLVLRFTETEINSDVKECGQRILAAIQERKLKCTP